MSRFDYIRYDEISTKQSEFFKAAFESIEKEVMMSLSDGRAKSLALTNLEEAYMWLGKAIRDEQIARAGDQNHVPERG